MVIYFEVPFDIMAQRLIERGKTSGRLDDNADTIRKRLQTFTDQTIPVVDHYKKINKTFVVSEQSEVSRHVSGLCHEFPTYCARVCRQSACRPTFGAAILAVRALK